MKRIFAILSVSLACAIALSSACVAAEDNAGHQSSVEAPFIVAAETGKPTTNVKQPTAADKAALANQIQQRYKPRVCTQSSGQIKACSVACSAACIFPCFPGFTTGPWSDACHTCVDRCMEHCTGCK